MELAAVTRVLSMGPTAAVIERDGLVVWASAALGVAIGARWTPPSDARGDALLLDGAPHQIWHVPRADSDGAELYRALFDVNAAIKLLLDPATGRIVDANRAAERFYGWTQAELRELSIFEINTLSTAEVTAELERARVARRTYFEFRHRTKHGALVDVEIYTGPIELRGRTLLLSIIHDVTERRRVELQLRHAQRLEALGRLAAGVAHDFNNLLTIINTSIQLALRRTGDVSELLTEVQAAARRGADLTRRLLALGSQQTLTPRPVAVDELISDTVILLRRTLPETIELVTAVAPGLPLVSVDRGQLDLVLLNLGLNARDAMPSGGTLTIHAREARDLPTLLPDGRYLAIAIEDTDVGMDAEVRARIFEPFFTTKPPGAGTGLGLPVAFGVVTQSGGTITVDSQPGIGTTFTMYLPLGAA